MKIKYIIDYKGYGNIYQVTSTRNGTCLDITKEEAQDFDESTTYFSAKADVSVRSVEQVEVKSPLGESLGADALQPYHISHWS